MKQTFLSLLAATMLLTGCASYDSWNRTTTGMSLGAMFGSTVGGIIGGYRGADAGMLIGGAVGGAVGAASAKAAETQRNESYNEGQYDIHRRNSTHRPSRPYASSSQRSYNDASVGYGAYDEYDYDVAAVTSQLEVSNIVFADANGNRVLESRERAYVTFEIYNRSNATVYNVAPIVTCDEKRINISPTAIIGDIRPGQGLRYKAAVVAKRNLRNRNVTFTIAFPDHNGNAVVVRSFHVRTEY